MLPRRWYSMPGFAIKSPKFVNIVDNPGCHKQSPIWGWYLPPIYTDIRYASTKYMNGARECRVFSGCASQRIFFAGIQDHPRVHLPFICHSPKNGRLEDHTLKNHPWYDIVIDEYQWHKTHHRPSPDQSFLVPTADYKLCSFPHVSSCAMKKVY